MFRICVNEKYRIMHIDSQRSACVLVKSLFDISLINENARICFGLATEWKMKEKLSKLIMVLIIWSTADIITKHFFSLFSAGEVGFVTIETLCTICLGLRRGGSQAYLYFVLFFTLDTATHTLALVVVVAMTPVRLAQLTKTHLLLRNLLIQVVPSWQIGYSAHSNASMIQMHL